MVSKKWAARRQGRNRGAKYCREMLGLIWLAVVALLDRRRTGFGPAPRQSPIDAAKAEDRTQARMASRHKDFLVGSLEFDQVRVVSDASADTNSDGSRTAERGIRRRERQGPTLSRPPCCRRARPSKVDASSLCASLGSRPWQGGKRVGANFCREPDELLHWPRDVAATGVDDQKHQRRAEAPSRHELDELPILHKLANCHQWRGCQYPCPPEARPRGRLDH